MVKKCSNCGKEVEFLDGRYYTPPEGEQVYLCKECLVEVDPSRKRQAEEELQRKQNKVITLKEYMARSGFSVSELQLQELVEIRNEIRTISTIVLIWFALGLIILILIIILTWMAIS
jgi:hypothetical protein